MTEFRDGWEIEGETVKAVRVQPDHHVTEGDFWVAFDDTGPYYLTEGQDLYFDRREAVEVLLNQVRVTINHLYEVRSRLIRDLDEAISEKLRAGKEAADADDATGLG